MKRSLQIVLALLWAGAAFAQSAPTWKANITGSVLWQKVTPMGTLVVTTTDGMYGIDPASGKVSWSQKSLSNVAEENYEVIPNTPFVAIVKPNGNVGEHTVINSVDGKILCNSKEAGIGVISRHILYETGNILLFGLGDKLSAVVAVFDISTGQMKWKKENLFGKSIFSEKIDSRPIEENGDAFVLATSGGLTGGQVYKISTSTGEVIWKAALPKLSGAQTTTVTETKLIKSVADPKTFYYLKGQNVMAYNFSDGKQAWSKPAKQSGLADRIIYDPEGLIIASAVDPNNNLIKPKLNMFDYKTGEAKWEKGAKLSGTVTNYSYSDKGLVVAMESEKGNYYINIVNLSSGEFVLNKDLKLKGALEEIKLCDKGVFYKTSNEVNILNLSSGDPVFPKSIRADKDQRLISSWKDESCYVFNPSDATLYEVSLKSASQKPLVKEQIQFSEKEIPTVIETRNNGIMLGSSQTVALYGFDGSKKFQTYFPSTGQSGFMKALLGVSAVLYAMDGLRYSAASAAFSGAAMQTKDPAGRAMFDAMGQVTGQVGSMAMSAAGAAMAELKKRFKATAAANNYVFMLTKIGDKEMGLVKINKDTGAKEGQISLGKDKTPSYQIDDISNLLYYRSNSNEISCYKF